MMEEEGSNNSTLPLDVNASSDQTKPEKPDSGDEVAEVDDGDHDSTYMSDEGVDSDSQDSEEEMETEDGKSEGSEGTKVWVDPLVGNAEVKRYKKHKDELATKPISDVRSSMQSMLEEFLEDPEKAFNSINSPAQKAMLEATGMADTLKDPEQIKQFMADIQKDDFAKDYRQCEEAYMAGHPGFDSMYLMTRLPPSFFRRLYQLAVEYYEAGPWRVCYNEDLVKLEAFDRSCCLQPMGRMGHEIGINLWRKWKHFWGMFSPEVDSGMDAIACFAPSSLQFDKPKNIDKQNMLFIEEHNLPGTACGRYANPMVYGRMSPMTLLEYKMFEVALQVLPDFYLRQLKPIDAFKFEPTKVTRTVYSSAEDRNVEVTLTFPAGPMSFYHQKYQNPLPRLMRFMLPFSPTVVTQIQAAEHLYQWAGKYGLPSRAFLETLSCEEIQQRFVKCRVKLPIETSKDALLDAADRARCRPGQYGPLALRTLALGWFLAELRTVALTLESIDLTWLVLHESIREARYQLIHKYLELHMYEDVVRVLQEFPKDSSVHFYWAVALLHYNKEGDTEGSRKSLKAAVWRNQYVVRYISEEDKIPSEDIHGYLQTVSEEGIVGNDHEAVVYSQTNLCHWSWVPGARPWVVKHGRAFRAELNSLAKSNPHYQYSLPGDPISGHALLPDLQIPTCLMLHCQYCKTRATAEQSTALRRCTGCLRAGYCSRECQLQDWSYHKKRWHKKKIPPKTAAA